MTQKLPPYAIAFYRPKIDFFEQKMASYWSLKDRIETESMKDSEIAQQFAEHAAALNDLTDEVSCWLPSDFCDKLFFDREPSEEDILAMYLDDFPDANADIMAFVQEVKLRPGHFQGLVIDKSTFDEAHSFLKNQNLKIAGVAATPDSSDYPSPIIFPAETGRVIEIAKPVSEEEVAEAPIVAAVEVEEPQAEVVEVQESEPLEKKDMGGAVAAAAVVADEGVEPAEEARPERENSKRKFALVAGISGLALIGLSSVFAYQKFDTPFAGNASVSEAPKAEIEFIDETDAGAEALVEVAEPELPATEPEGDEPSQVASLETDVVLSDEFGEIDGPSEVDTGVASSDDNAVSVSFEERPEGHKEEFVEPKDESKDVASLQESLEDSPFKPDLSLLEPKSKSGAKSDAPKVAPSEPAEEVIKIDIPPDRNSQILQEVAKRVEAKQKKIAGSSASDISGGNQSSGSPTLQNQINLNQLALLGIYGPTGKPMAMLRSSGGRVESLKKGESIDGWQVVAISKSDVIVTKNGNQMRLFMPN